MKITYDVEFLPAKKGSGGKQSEEVLAVIAFLANGQKKNMYIEYDDLKDCKNKFGAIRRYQKRNELAEVFNVYRVENRIYVVKCKKPTRGKQEKGDSKG